MARHKIGKPIPIYAWKLWQQLLIYGQQKVCDSICQFAPVIASLRWFAPDCDSRRVTNCLRLSHCQPWLLMMIGGRNGKCVWPAENLFSLQYENWKSCFWCLNGMYSTVVRVTSIFVTTWTEYQQNDVLADVETSRDCRSSLCDPQSTNQLDCQNSSTCIFCIAFCIQIHVYQ